MVEWLKNLDVTSQAIIALIAYIFFPQFWPKIKELLNGLKSNKVSPPVVPSITPSLINESDDIQRLIIWIELLKQSESLNNKKLNDLLLSMPSLLVNTSANKKEANNVQ